MFDDVIKNDDWEQFEADFEEAFKDVNEVESFEHFIEIIDNFLEKQKCMVKIA